MWNPQGINKSKNKYQQIIRKTFRPTLATFKNISNWVLPSRPFNPAQRADMLCLTSRPVRLKAIRGSVANGRNRKDTHPAGADIAERWLSTRYAYFTHVHLIFTVSPGKWTIAINCIWKTKKYWFQGINNKLPFFSWTNFKTGFLMHVGELVSFLKHHNFLYSQKPVSMRKNRRALKIILWESWSTWTSWTIAWLLNSQSYDHPSVNTSCATLTKLLDLTFQRLLFTHL